MGHKFVAAGCAIIDRIFLYGESEVHATQVGGGGVYSATGIRFWEDDVACAAYSGKDFDEHYAEYAALSGIDFSGVVKKYPRTRLVDIIYVEDGTFDCADHWEEYRNPHADTVDAALLRPLVGKNTDAIHIMGRPLLDNMAEVYALAKENDALLGVEYESFWFFEQGRVKEQMRELEKHLDMFSLNSRELRELFPDIRDNKDALELLCSFEKPCFYRIGTGGAYYIKDHVPYYSPMIDEFGTADPTGCGNTSTAAVTWAMSKGMEPLEISYVGAVTAAYNASFKGLITNFDKSNRDAGYALLKKHLELVKK